VRVLVCGASGCVGRAVVAALRWRGHVVVETTRGPGLAATGAVTLDFMTPVAPEHWATRLRELDIDAVVNCVGVLMAAGGASFERIHSAGPIELFRGAVAAGVGRVVQVSALGVGTAADAAREPAYLRSKRCADEALLALAIDAAVVRPSLVYGPGSASARLFATLASLPIVSLPGKGDQRVQPLHVFELAEAIAALVERRGSARGVYELGGAASISYREMLAAYRAAQGLGEAIWLSVPMPLMRVGALVAEHLPQRAFCRDTLALLERGNVAARNASHVLLGRAPAALAEGLGVTPPEPALDLRVAIAPPVAVALRVSLAFLWLYTAIVSAVLPQQSGVLELLARCGFAGDAGWLALMLSCALNLALGLLTLLRPTARLYAVQAMAVAGYTLTAAIHVPALTIDHCGPLAKNVPILMCVVVLWLAAASTPAPRPARQRERRDGGAPVDRREGDGWRHRPSAFLSARADAPR
jgi:nucleoside-diphosphate-sugar epimerase